METPTFAERRPSAPEVVEYQINTADEPVELLGVEVQPGNVAVRSGYGCSWEMTAAGFDRIYKTGVKK